MINNSIKLMKKKNIKEISNYFNNFNHSFMKLTELKIKIFLKITIKILTLISHTYILKLFT